MAINKLWICSNGRNTYVIGPTALNEIFENTSMRSDDTYVHQTLDRIQKEFDVTMGMPMDGTPSTFQTLRERIVLREIIEKNSESKRDKVDLVKGILRLEERCRKLGISVDSVNIEVKDYTEIEGFMRDYESHLLLLNSQSEDESDPRKVRGFERLRNLHRD